MSASAGSAPCVLITIPISHYCEKARWALERAGVPYTRAGASQVIHRFAARRAGGGTTVPVLVCGERVLPESAEIVDDADRRAPADRRLYPEDEDAAAEVRELERGFDESLGPHGRRWMYDQIRSGPISSRRTAAPASPPGSAVRSRFSSRSSTG